MDKTGAAVVRGSTGSTDFPTRNALQGGIAGMACLDNSVTPPNPIPCTDIVVAKLTPSGTAFVFSTYLGGVKSEAHGGIAVDDAGTIYVTGQTASSDFPVTGGAYSTTGPAAEYTKAFLVRISSTGTNLLYGTYFGGSNANGGDAIAVDISGNAYVTGYTASDDLPVTTGAIQSQRNTDDLGTFDAFVAKFSPFVTRPNSSSTARTSAERATTTVGRSWSTRMVLRTSPVQRSPSNFGPRVAPTKQAARIANTTTTTTTRSLPS